jgi:hypothetical protein
MITRRPRLLATLSISLLCSYLCIVLVYQEPLAGLTVRTRHLVVILLAAYALIFLVFWWLDSQDSLSRERALQATILSLSLLVSLLAADSLYAVYERTSRAVPPPEVFDRERSTDPRIWIGELYPRSYYPTERNFTLYKPNVRISGRIFGEFYDTRMLASPTLVESVLELREVVYSIDEHGFRNRAPLSESRLFALGDSFVFGYSTAEGDIWTERLAELIGTPVYNLGVSATGPGSQVQLLEFLLRSEAHSFRVEHLLWMIFEGNDLENSYATTRSHIAAPARVSARLWRATLRPLIQGTKNRSIIAKLMRGDLTLRDWSSGSDGNPYLVDGISLEFPLYHSDRWGYKLFNPIDIDRARKTEAYVLSHPNRRLFDDSFRRMRTLSEEFGFRVTVLLAPSAARMYGPDFQGFPELSAEPHFMRYVEALSRNLGFEVVDMLTLMKPQAEREILYYRDDHHWNERGNEIAALTIASVVQF